MDIRDAYQVKTRVREHSDLSELSSLTTSYVGPGTKWTTVTNYPFSVVGKQETTSRPTTWKHHKRLMADPKVSPLIKGTEATLDIGTNFRTINRYLQRTNSRIVGDSGPSGFTRYSFQGLMSPTGGGTFSSGSGVWPQVVDPTSAELFALGGTAISKCIPTHPAASLATTLGELREKLPQLPGLASTMWARNGQRNLKGAANQGSGEYLNWQFGVAPTIADMRKIADAHRKADKIIANFLRNSGRQVRRSYRFPVVETEEVLSVDQNKGLYPALPTGIYRTTNSHLGTVTKTRTTRIEVWFSGAFTYHAVVGDDLLSRMRAASQRTNQVYGTRLTPEVVWNLAPWSWLADWFSNTGNVITNATALANDGLVMRYGYLMYHKTVTDTYTHSGIAFKSGETGPVSWSFTTDLKLRVKAHPFGFGLTDMDLSPRQLAILAALGVSRAT